MPGYTDEKPRCTVVTWSLPSTSAIHNYCYLNAHITGVGFGFTPPQPFSIDRVSWFIGGQIVNIPGDLWLQLDITGNGGPFLQTIATIPLDVGGVRKVGEARVIPQRIIRPGDPNVVPGGSIVALKLRMSPGMSATLGPSWYQLSMTPGAL
jgi:hypothetical protein